MAWLQAGSLKKSRILTALMLVYAIVSAIATAMDGGDFDVYLDASGKLSELKNIYSAPFIKGLQYYYSPFFAWLLIPVARHVFMTEVVFVIISYLFLYRSFQLMRNYYDFSKMPVVAQNTWAAVVLFFSIQFILYNVSMIQITFFLLWSILEALRLIESRRPLLSGALLGLAINIKLMPLLILPYLFYRGHFTVIFSMLLSFVFLLFVPALGIGFDFNMFLLSEWWSVINPVNKEHMFETGIGTHSVVALIPVFLTDTVGEIPVTRNFINLPHSLVEMITNLVRLFLLGLSLLFLRSWPFRSETNPVKRIWEISYFLLLIPLLMPHQQKYNFIFVIPMIAYLWYYHRVKFSSARNMVRQGSFIVFILAVAVFSPLYGSDVIGKKMFLLTQHFRLMTICTILLIPLSLICHPCKLNTLHKQDP